MCNTSVSVCRDYLVFKLIKGLEDKKFLEIGVGTGDFTIKLGKRSFSGKGIDVADKTLEIARNKIKELGIPEVIIEKNDLFNIENEEYGIIFMFSVFEHLENDLGALKKINNLLGEKGTFIFQVPAHMDMWSKSDELVGHIRRYERDEIIEKLDKAGYSIEEIYTFGFPILNIIKIFRDYLNKRNFERKKIQYTQDNLERKERTEESPLIKALNVPDWIYNLVYNSFTMFPFMLLQKLFLQKDWGTEYLVKCKVNKNHRPRTEEHSQ